METQVSETILDAYCLGAQAPMLLKEQMCYRKKVLIRPIISKR